MIAEPDRQARGTRAEPESNEAMNLNQKRPWRTGNHPEMTIFIEIALQAGKT